MFNFAIDKKILEDGGDTEYAGFSSLPSE